MVVSYIGTFLRNTIVGAIESTFPNNGGGLKLESHKIVDFSGSNDDWPSWKSKTMCVLTGGDYGKHLKDTSYARRHPKKNRILFSLLASATIDGTANHIVQDFEETADGAGAWDALCSWYDGDVLLTETAENTQDKLRHLKLKPGVSASDCINKFLTWKKDLNKIEGEGWSDRTARYNFLENIVHEECQITKANLMTTNASLTDCVVALRKRERQIMKEQRDKRMLKQTVRRWVEEHGYIKQNNDDESHEPPSKKRRTNIESKAETERHRNPEFKGELKTSKGGYLNFADDCWNNKMSDEDKAFVKQWNSKIRCNKDTDVPSPEGITVVRRQQQVKTANLEKHNALKDSKNPSRKRIRFNLDEEDDQE